MENIEVKIFGKEGCKKCESLKFRLDKHIGEKNLQGIKIIYHDIMTADGLAEAAFYDIDAFERIPAIMIFKKGQEVYKEETDYTDKGIIEVKNFASYLQ